MKIGKEKERENSYSNSALTSKELDVKRQKFALESKFPKIYSLSAAGNVLVKERGKSNSGELIGELKLLQQTIAKLDKEAFRCEEEEFGFVYKMIENHHFTKSNDQLIGAIVACIAVDLLNVSSSKCSIFNVPSLSKILEFVVMELKNLREVESACFAWTFYLLESLASKGQLLLVFKLNPDKCDQIIFNAFSIILDAIRDDHSASALAHCRQILEQLLNESPYVAENLVELVLERMLIRYGCSASQNLLKLILGNCSGKIDQYIAQFYATSIASYKGKGKELDRIFSNIFKLFCLVPECTVSLWSMLAEECQSADELTRKRAEDCVSKMLSQADEGQSLIQRAPYLWNTWIQRACDKSVSIRQNWLLNVPAIVNSCHIDIDDDQSFCNALVKVSNDLEEVVRLDFFRMLLSLEKIPNSLLSTLFTHLNDKEHNVRKAVLKCCTKLGWKSEEMCKALFSLMYTKDRRTKNQFEEYLESEFLGPEVDNKKLLWIFEHFTEHELNAFTSIIQSKAVIYKLVDFCILIANGTEIAKGNMQKIIHSYRVKFDDDLQNELDNLLELFINDLKRLSILSLESFFESTSNVDFMKLFSIDSNCSKNFECSDNPDSNTNSEYRNSLYYCFLKRINCKFFNSKFVSFLAANFDYHENIPKILQSVLCKMPYHGKMCLDILVDQFLCGKHSQLTKPIKYIIGRNKEIVLKRKDELLSFISSKCDSVDSLKYKKTNEIDRKSFELFFLLDNDSATSYLTSVNTSFHSYWLILSIIAKVCPHILQNQLKIVVMNIRDLLESLLPEDVLFILKLFFYISKENKNVTIFNIFRMLATSLVKSVEKRVKLEETNDKTDSALETKTDSLIPYQINTNVSYIFYTFGKFLSLSPVKPFLLNDFISVIQNENFATRKEFVFYLRKGIFHGKLSPIFCTLLFLSCVDPSHSLQMEAKEVIKMVNNTIPLIKILEHLLILLSCHPDLLASSQDVEIKNLCKRFINYFFEFTLNKQTVSGAYWIATKLSKCKFIDSSLQSSNELLSSLCTIATSIIVSIAQSSKLTIQLETANESVILEYETGKIIHQQLNN